MKLEILHTAPKGNRKNKHILFVHGICVGGWVWQKNFMPYFADAGYDTWAVSLRGHGNSEGREDLNYASLLDYVDDLHEAIQQIGSDDLIVVGHSMGGAVVQRWMREGGEAKGVCLMASVPPWGLSVAAFHMLFNSPQLYREIFTMSWVGIDRVKGSVLRNALFSDDISDADFAQFMSKASDESVRVGCQLQGFVPIAPMMTDIPVFVMGGEKDKFIPKYDVRNTAIYYGTRALIVPTLSHAMMLETSWKDAADPLLDWVNKL